MLASEAVVLATLSCREPWIIIGLLAAGTVPPYVELRARGKPTGVFVWHMGAFVALMVIGWAFVDAEGGQRLHGVWAILPLLIAIFLRSGIVPLHCWMTDLFEHATFGTAHALPSHPDPRCLRGRTDWCCPSPPVGCCTASDSFR